MRNRRLLCLSLATCCKSSTNRSFSCFWNRTRLHILKLSRLTEHYRLVRVLSWHQVPNDLMLHLHLGFQWCQTSAWRLLRFLQRFLLNKWILLRCSTFLLDFTNLFTTWFFAAYSTGAALSAAATSHHLFAQELRSKRRLRSFRKFGCHQSLLLLLLLARRRSLYHCLELPIAIVWALLISFKCSVALIIIRGVLCRCEWALASSVLLLAASRLLCKRGMALSRWILWCHTISLTLRRATMILLSGAVASHRSVMPCPWQANSATATLRWLWSLRHRFDRHRPPAEIWLVLWVISLQLIWYSF